MKQVLGILIAAAGLVAAPFVTDELERRKATRLREDLESALSQLRPALPAALMPGNANLAPQVDAALISSHLQWLLRVAFWDFAASPEQIVREDVANGPAWQALRENGAELTVLFDRRAFDRALDGSGVGEAAAQGSAVHLVPVGDEVKMLAFAEASGLLVRASGRAMAPVFVVATLPFDDKLLMKAVTAAGGAVVLTDGRQVLAHAGPSEDVHRLATRVGHEGEATAWLSPALEWGATAVRLNGALWAWAFREPGPGAVTTREQAATLKGVVWGAGGLLVIVGVVLFISGAFGRKRRQQHDGPLAGVSAPAPGVSTGQHPSPFFPPEDTLSRVRATGGSAVVAHSQLGGVTDMGGALAGITLGRYTLLAPHGEGGMAEIYKAATFGTQGFRRRFVVKRLRSEFVNNPEAVAQFIDEAKLASTLVHGNIVAVLDFGELDGKYFMASEYILGRDLKQITARHIEREGAALAPGVVLRCASEVCKALAFVHSKVGEDGAPLGLVHRDISPGNVMISVQGEVKLLDFGIVKAQRRTAQTQQGMVKGNLLFMAPEQARAQVVDARADLFSLGLVMYYAATGSFLYTGSNEYELIVQAAAGPDADAWARITALPAPLPDILSRALAVHPADRFQSATEFRKALAGYARENSASLGHVLSVLFADDLRAEEESFAEAMARVEGGEVPEQMRNFA